MPVAPARPIAPTAAERERLKKMAYGHKTEHRLRVRAQIVLHAARGRSNARIAHETGLHLDTVRAWRGRFAHGGMPALADRKRSGRPARFTPVQVAGAKALACQLPAETGVPLSRWSCPELAAELTARGITETVSASTVRRWLREDALKPWQYRSWIFIRDPDFRAKTPACLGSVRLHVRWCPTGRGRVRPVQRREDFRPGPLPLPSDPGPGPGPGDACQPRVRPWRRAGLPGRRRRPPREGLRPLRAEDRIVPFMALVTQVMTTEPYARARRVFWIVDNGSSHRGKKAIDRLTTAFPNAVMVHTPIHASWTNRIEIFFSIVQRKVVTPNDFTDLTQVRDRLRAFEDRYNATTQPFQWKFTTSDLDDLLARLDRHTPANRQEESSVALAA